MNRTKQAHCLAALLFFGFQWCSADTGQQDAYQAGLQAAREGNAKQAFSLYTKAATAGIASAQYELGEIYAKGQGVNQDYNRAVEWYTKAAKQGLAQAQYALGKLYEGGDGVPQDYKQALVWYRKAADQGYANAQTAIGVLYQQGKGVTANHKLAFEWYKKAANQGNAIAQSNLGNLLLTGQDFEGKGVESDILQAIEWYKKAADQGNAIAQINLAGIYIQGYTVDIDLAEGYKWLILARTTDPDRAEKLLSTVEAKISANDLAEGKRRASEWQAAFDKRKESN